MNTCLFSLALLRKVSQVNYTLHNTLPSLYSVFISQMGYDFHVIEYGLEGLIEFKWKNFEDGKQVWPSVNSFLIFFLFLFQSLIFF